MYQYKVDGRTFDDPKAVVDYCFTEDDNDIDDSEYDDLLTETYGEVSICGYKYDSAYALKEVDPTAYRTGYLDWFNDRFDEIKDELFDEIDALDDGDEVEINGWTVQCIDIDDDDDMPL